MKRLIPILLAALAALSCNPTPQAINSNPDFITIDGPNLIAPDGSKFFIRGTNLGNWLNPEGYMFGFQRTNSVGAGAYDSPPVRRNIVAVTGRRGRRPLRFLMYTPSGN